MKLYTDQGNFQTLKLLVAAEISKITLEVKSVSSNDHVVHYLKDRRLPVLEVFPDKFLFSSNAAARYLLSETLVDDNVSAVDQWLDWESACLFPSVFPYLLSNVEKNKIDESLIQEVKSHVNHLNTELKGKQYIAGDHITVADVAIFATLFPVFSGKLAIKGLDTDFTEVQKWLSALTARPEFHMAIQAVFRGGDSTSLKDSLVSQPAPLRHKVQLKHVQKQPSKVKEESAAPEKVIANPEEIKAATDAWLNGKKLCPQPVNRKHPILPEKGKRNLLITSALPYVNNVPHLGNIIGCVLSADVFSRYCRLRNYNSIYVCGTDEYGTATETKAIAEGLTPQQICDKYTEIHKEIYDWFNIDFDYFGRTTTQHQTSIAQDIFWQLYKNGFISKDSVEQLHCKNCDRFLADRFVEGICPLCSFEDARGDQCDACGKLINATELVKPKCKVCKNSPEVRSSDHLFLDLPKVEPKLQSHLTKVFESGTWTNNAKVITNSWIRDGLKPRCISRDLKWGTPVPLKGYTDKVFYVWFDAPIGYLSITANYTEQWERWWKNPDNVEMYNFLGKDNVPFHSVIFPATLLGADDNYSVVNHMSATEYLNYEDGKFSKSRETGVFGDQARDTGIPADIYRFYLLFVRPETQDSSFSWDDFLLKNNSELLNNLGNFINRALTFVSNSFGGVIQEMVLNADDYNLLALVNRELHTYIENMESARLRDSIRNILNISRLGNQFMQENKPWQLVKGSEADRQRAGSVVSLAANISCLLCVLLQPYMPQVSSAIQGQLNAPSTCNVVYEDFLCHLLPGHKIGIPSPLFQKIESSTIADLKKKFAGKGTSDSCKAKGKKVNEQMTGVKGSPEEIEKLQTAVTTQGNKVRELKANKAEKSVIAGEVAKLLDLKKQLASYTSQETPSSGGGKKMAGGKQQKLEIKQDVTGPVNVAEVEKFTAAVTEQGNKVRELKKNKAEKGVIDTEVNKLLNLKRQLAVAQGIDPDANVGGGKKKGKK